MSRDRRKRGQPAPGGQGPAPREPEHQPSPSNTALQEALESAGPDDVEPTPFLDAAEEASAYPEPIEGASHMDLGGPQIGPGLLERLDSQTPSPSEVDLQPGDAALSPGELDGFSDALQDEGDPLRAPLQEAIDRGSATISDDAVHMPGMPNTAAAPELLGAVQALGPKATELDVRGNAFEVRAKLNPWVHVFSGGIDWDSPPQDASRSDDPKRDWNDDAPVGSDDDAAMADDESGSSDESEPESGADSPVLPPPLKKARVESGAGVATIPPPPGSPLRRIVRKRQGALRRKHVVDDESSDSGEPSPRPRVADDQALSSDEPKPKPVLKKAGGLAGPAPGPAPAPGPPGGAKKKTSAERKKEGTARQCKQRTDAGFTKGADRSGWEIPDKMLGDRGRSFNPKTDGERQEQLMRQMGTVLLDRHSDGVEVQTLYAPSRGARGGLITGTNKAKVNEDLRTAIGGAGSLGAHLEACADDIIARDRERKNKKIRFKEDKQTKGSRTAVNKDAALRRAFKLKQSLSGKRKRPGTANMLKLLKDPGIGRFEPGDELPEDRAAVLGQNLSVRGNPKVEEHAEVNYLAGAAKEAGGDCVIAGPKCPCATCRQKGVEMGVFPDGGATGKLFTGQLPRQPDQDGVQEFDPDFLAAVEKRARDRGIERSANLQYAQSESDVSVHKSDVSESDESDVPD